MPWPAEFLYTTDAAITAILQLQGSLTIDPAVVHAKHATAGRIINNYCHRVFAVVTAEARTFDAPASTLLDVPDLLAVTSVLQDGGALVAGTDYELLPHTRTATHRAYTQVQRLSSGFARRWGYKPLARAQVASVSLGRADVWDLYPAATPYGPYAPTPTPDIGTITITGDWGFDSAVPDDVREAAEILAVKLYNRRGLKYVDDPGVPGQPPPRQPHLVDDYVATLLDAYVYTPTPEGNA